MNTELLHKYLSGECSKAEEKQVESWLRSSPKNQEKMDEIKQIWDITPGKRIHVDSHEAWGALHERVFRSRKAVMVSMPYKKKQPGFYKPGSGRQKGFRMAAYFAAAAAVLLIAFLFSNSVTPTSGPSVTELSMQEITTTRGQRTSVKLSDGTRVWLNADSKLVISDAYKNNNRTVYLEGEAYFEIVPDAKRKFFVHANHSITQVLGTKFNVRAYPDEDNVEVVVAEGKVSMSPGRDLSGPEVQLTQNQRGTFSKHGEIIASTISDVDHYLDWTNGRLTFYDAPVGEVKNRLERWYDIEIIQKGDFPVNDHLLTGSFENVPLSVVLASIALSLDVNYTQDDNTVIFSKK